MNKEQQIIEWFDKNSSEIKSNINLICCREYTRSDFKDFFGGLVRLIIYIRYNDFDIIQRLIHAVCFYSLLEVSDYFGLNINFVLKQLRDTLIKKNRDYGNSFDKSIKKFGWIYLAIELDKKKNRLHNLLKSKENPNYESIEDTLLDIAGYCVLALIYIDNNKE